MPSDHDSHLRPGAGGAALSLPQSTKAPTLDSSNSGMEEFQGISAADNRDTRLLRAIVRSTAIVLCISITADIFNTTLFALHPIFISLGFLGFMSEGVLLAHAFRSLEGPDRVKAIWRHAIMQIAASASIAIGFGAIYFNKIRLGKPHFKSYHGFLGFIATLAAALVALMGAGAFRRLGLLQKLPLSMQPLLKQAHTLAGAAVWGAALFNVLLGLRTHGAGPRLTLHYGQGVAVLIMAVAQGALLLQRKPAPRAEQEDAARTHSEEILLQPQGASVLPGTR